MSLIIFDERPELAELGVITSTTINAVWHAASLAGHGKRTAVVLSAENRSPIPDMFKKAEQRLHATIAAFGTGTSLGRGWLPVSCCAVIPILPLLPLYLVVAPTHFYKSWRVSNTRNAYWAASAVSAACSDLNLDFVYSDVMCVSRNTDDTHQLDPCTAVQQMHDGWSNKWHVCMRADADAGGTCRIYHPSETVIAEAWREQVRVLNDA